MSDKLDGSPPAGPPARYRLAETCRSVTHKFRVGVGASAAEGYLVVELFDDGRPGGLFIYADRIGPPTPNQLATPLEAALAATVQMLAATVRGILVAFAIEVSLALQRGVPLAEVAAKHRHTRFEPAGFTGCERVPMTSSILDYVFAWMLQRWPEREASTVKADAAPDAPSAEAP